MKLARRASPELQTSRPVAQVVHNGTRARYVVYAVLHHPGLGTPVLEEGCAADGGAEEGGVGGVASAGLMDELD